MQTHLSRRALLRGDVGRIPFVARPPWAIEERQFQRRCTRCGDCLAACPQGILAASAGYPVVAFERGGCTFCGECAGACRAGAIERQSDAPPWSLSARIGADCLARERVVCRRCAESCESAAIRFSLRAGTSALPRIDDDRCSGCGACVSTCPTRAIHLLPRTFEE